jgi:hypothetical protein
MRKNSNDYGYKFGSAQSGVGGADSNAIEEAADEGGEEVEVASGLLSDEMLEASLALLFDLGGRFGERS